MYINLSARKANGDFIVTSTAVLQDHGVPYHDLRRTIEEMAKDYKAQGYDVELIEDFDGEYSPFLTINS
jgi:hypothetical protein